MEPRLQRIATILSWIKTSIAPSKNVTISRIGQFTRILLYFRNAASEKIHFYSPLNLIHVYARVYFYKLFMEDQQFYIMRETGEASSPVFQISWLETWSFDGRYLSSCLHRFVNKIRNERSKKLKGVDINFFKRKNSCEANTTEI